MLADQEILGELSLHGISKLPVQSLICLDLQGIYLCPLLQNFSLHSAR